MTKKPSKLEKYIDDLGNELDQLAADQAKATCWGAAVGERGKRIDALWRELARQADTRNELSTSAEAVENPCPNCEVTLNGHSGLRYMGARVTHDRAYCMRYLRDSRDALAAERDALQAKLDEAVEAADKLAEWVEGIIEDGCAKCGGDCSSANPPLAYCPMREAMQDLAALRAIQENDDAQ